MSKTITVDKEFFVHLLNCMAKQKSIYPVQGGYAGKDEPIQEIIDAAYRKAKALLSQNRQCDVERTIDFPVEEEEIMVLERALTCRNRNGSYEPESLVELSSALDRLERFTKRLVDLSAIVSDEDCEYAVVAKVKSRA